MSSLNELLLALGSADETDRRYAIQDLADLGQFEAIVPIAKALNDEAPAVREAAVDALVQFGGEQTCTSVLPLLASESPPERNAACEVLERIGAPAVGLLTETAFQSSNIDVRKFAVDIVSNVRGLDGELRQRALKGLGSLLNDANENVAIAAAEALGKIGDASVLPLLLERLPGATLWKQCSILQAALAAGKEQGAAALASLDGGRLHSEAKSFLSALLAESGAA